MHTKRPGSSSSRCQKFPFAARSYQQSLTSNLDRNDDVSSLLQERSHNRARGGWCDPFDDLSEAEEALDIPHSLGGAHGGSQQSSRNDGSNTGLSDSTYSEEAEAIQDLIDWFNRSVTFYLFTVPDVWTSSSSEISPKVSLSCRPHVPLSADFDPKNISS